MALQRAPLPPSFFQSWITRRCTSAKRLYLPASVGVGPRYPARYRSRFPTQIQLAKRPRHTPGPFFMPRAWTKTSPVTAHGLHRGPFFLILILVTSATAAPRERLYPSAVCVRHMERPAPGQRSTPGTPRPVLARFYGDSSPVFTPVALLHRSRFYARFWGIVAPHTGIPDAPGIRINSRSIPQNAPDRAKTADTENDRSTASLRHSQKSGTRKPYSARESREAPGDRSDFPPLVGAKVVTAL